MITRCAECPFYTLEEIQFVASRGQSPTNGTCQKARRKVVNSNQQPDWCPLTEEDPNNT